MIVISFNTKGYGGKSVAKSITIQTNDPEKSKTTLKLRGKVDKIADISSKTVRLEGLPGENLSEVVTITPLEKYSFKIFSTTVNSNDNINVTFKKINLSENNAVKRPVYELYIKNIKQTPGRYYESIHLKTDLKTLPEITIRVIGFIRHETGTQIN